MEVASGREPGRRPDRRARRPGLHLAVNANRSSLRRRQQGDRLRIASWRARHYAASIRRAGADIVITYHAKEAARWLSE